MATAATRVEAVDLAEVADAVGPRSFERGRAFARGGRVTLAAWDDDGRTLTGAVAGNGGLYDTTAYFVADPGGALAFEDGECTCPVGLNCKHVAALAIAATTGQDAAPAAGARRLVAAVPEHPAWEESLHALIAQPALQETGSPLAIELGLRPSGISSSGALRLTARLMRPGARGGWVNGSLAWNELEWQVHANGLRADHVAVARELYAAQRAGRVGVRHLYNYGAEKALDLTDCGAQLWSLLDEAARIGVHLVHAGKGLGEIAAPQPGEILIDVSRREDGGSRVAPVMRIDGEDADPLRPVLFLGAGGHGVICVDARDQAGVAHQRLTLVRLRRAAAPALQRLLLEGEPVTIAAADLPRFAEEICPALRNVAPVVSSDGSFTAPEVSAPALTLRARFGDGHRAELGWMWTYRVGDATHETPLDIADGCAGFRDREAERAMLATTALAGAGLEALGIVDAEGRPAEGPGVALAGVATMRLVSDHLPRLRDVPGIEVFVEGEPAEYRDVADTLEIGLSTAEIAGERDWFDLGVTLRVDGRDIPFTDVFVALATGQSHVLLDDGAHFALADPRLLSLRALIDEARELTDPASSGLRISRYQAGLWEELAALGVVTEQADAWQRHVGTLLQLDALSTHDPPTTLVAQLRPYQREGFAWLASLWDLELGGILADDMGLGKTLQTLALIAHVKERAADSGPFLIVAPTSVVPNWVAEAARFVPSLSVRAATSTLAKSGQTIDELARADVIVTTYTLLRLDADAYGSVGWSGVVLDEAQAVKNHQSKTYKCVRQVAAPFTLALTGTPMENNLMELWSLLSITAPGLFPDPARFAQEYARPIERRGDTDRLGRLRRRIRPLVKRRTKELVAGELPAKQEQELAIELHPRHRRLYDTFLQRERQKILRLLGDFDRNRFTILRSITLLRQLSLDAGLVSDGSVDIPCAKIAALTEQLEDVVGGGHRALVFSQFTSFLGRLRERLDRDGIEYCYLDGKTRRRGDVLERFKTGSAPVFLISLKAGGVGLNLTEADYCFLLDPWWNPATENQAIDRTHRIGQTRPVMVYRLIARDTIEEKVVALARRKAALFRGVMDDGDLFAGQLTADDIRDLLR